MKKLALTFAPCLMLIVTVWALVFSQVGADKRPPKPPLRSSAPKKLPKMPPKRTPERIDPNLLEAPCSVSSPTSATGRGYTEALAGARLEMVEIPPGSFCMGAPGTGSGDAHPRHVVTVPSFYLGKYEVTLEQWRAVMGSEHKSYAYRGGDQLIDTASFNEAIAFCQRLSQITGKHYRLPTEAEWEYAARAGKTGIYAYKPPSPYHFIPDVNGFGLNGMLFTPNEYCEDWYHENYEGAPTDGSAWLTGGSIKTEYGEKGRVMRGNYEYPSLTSRNYSGASSYACSACGFRVAADMR